jgi:hypothetical protein
VLFIQQLFIQTFFVNQQVEKIQQFPPSVASAASEGRTILQQVAVPRFPTKKKQRNALPS